MAQPASVQPAARPAAERYAALLLTTCAVRGSVDTEPRNVAEQTADRNTASEVMRALPRSFTRERLNLLRSVALRELLLAAGRACLRGHDPHQALSPYVAQSASQARAWCGRQEPRHMRLAAFQAEELGERAGSHERASTRGAAPPCAPLRRAASLPSARLICRAAAAPPPAAVSCCRSPRRADGSLVRIAAERASQPYGG